MPPKDHNNFFANDPKEMEICKLSAKRFEVIILKKLSEIQENTDRQFNDLGKTALKK